MNDSIDLTLSPSDSFNLAGFCLLAMPSMKDPFFAGTLVLICEHGPDGAMGLVLNQPSSNFMGSMVERLGLLDVAPEMLAQPVYAGGPVAPERGFVLHTPDPQWSQSQRITEALYLTTSRDILFALATGKGPAHWMLMVGYSAWHTGQLEQELASNAWLVVPSSPELLFDCAPEARYMAGFGLLGIQPHNIAPFQGHA